VGRRQFNRQRQAVQPGADRCDVLGVLFSQPEIARNRPRALHEECDRSVVRQGFERWKVMQVGDGQWRDRELEFALHPQDGAAGQQDLELGAGRE